MKQEWLNMDIVDICSQVFAGGDVPKKRYSKIQTSKYNIPIYANGENGNGLYGYTDIARVNEPSITVSARGTIGFSVIRNEPYFPVVRLIVLVPNKKVINLSFLHYAVRLISFKNSGTSIPQLTVPMIKKYKINFPKSLNEQHRIVTILDNAFAAIDQAKANIEKNIENSKELFQSKLNEIFSQKEGWKEKKLGELGKVSMCKRIYRNQTSSEGEIPFYKIGTFGKTPNAFISHELYNEYRNKYSFPKKGDILISASGTIGRSVIYDGKPAYFQDSNIVWIDNDEKLVLNDFLYQFYKVCDWNPSKGATISRLYNDDLRKIKISYPRIDEQKSIITKSDILFEQTEELKKHYHHKIKILDELKKSLLQKAFTGELTAKEIAV